MKTFINDNFMLQNKTAVRLYHDYAKNMPIFDYHCHLNPQEIADNKSYKNITEIWLGGDHYKWRALRSNGIDEKYITGDASDREKFNKWAETMPYCIGNPLYHWTHLELKRYFGIDELLSPETAESIWNKCNEMLQSDDFTARSLIKNSNVKALCTTDDPVDSLEHHIALAGSSEFDVAVLPSFRPDKGINIDKKNFTGWISKLENASSVEINTFEDLKKALRQRIEFFHQAGCRLSDHALEPPVYVEADDSEISSILQKALSREPLSSEEIKKYKTQVMIFLGSEYSRLGWVMQIHIGTIRNNNIRMMNLLGPDTGFDAIGDYLYASSLSNFLDKLEQTRELPRTILYCLNPRDNEVLGAIIGCFQGSEVPGKIQMGSGWWFNDQKDGMIKQMTALANVGLLRRFIGMLTDSRSFLSYTRHEYFRRILCNLLGTWAEDGEVPDNVDLLGQAVQEISFINAQKYFNIDALNGITHHL